MRGRAAVATAVLGVLVVGACSGPSGSHGSSVAGGEAQVGRAAVPAPAPGSPSRAAPAGSAAGAAAGGSSAGDLAAALPLADGYQIRTADMTVAVPAPTAVGHRADEAIAIAVRAGGEVDSDNRVSGRHASATLTLRVPPEALTATLTALSRLGHEQNRQLSTTDVTQKVADVNSRVRSAQDSIARLRALYAQATRIADIIEIESELNSREADLESLEAQQRALAHETSMATVTLNLVTAAKKPVSPAHPAAKRGGFLGGLERGWDGFTAAASWVAGAVGVLLPFLALLALLAGALRLLGRRLPRLPHRHGPAPTPGE